MFKIAVNKGDNHRKSKPLINKSIRGFLINQTLICFHEFKYSDNIDDFKMNCLIFLL